MDGEEKGKGRTGEERSNREVKRGNGKVKKKES